MSTTPSKLRTGSFIAAIPRLMGYIPTGRVVVAMIKRDGGALQGMATVDAVTDEQAAAAAAALRRNAAPCDEPLVVLVIGWRGKRSMRGDTVRLADQMTLAGFDVIDQITTDGRRYRRMHRGEGDRPVAAAIGPVAQMGQTPRATREDAVSAWESTGTITPQPAATEADGIQAWHAVLNGQPTAEQISHAAWALTNIAQRDRILVALTGMDLIDEDLGQARTLTAYRDQQDLLPNLQQAINQMQPGSATALPMLTIAAAVAFARGDAAAGPLTDQITETDPHQRYRLAALLVTTIRAGLRPTALLGGL